MSTVKIHKVYRRKYSPHSLIAYIKKSTQTFYILAQTSDLFPVSSGFYLFSPLYTLGGEQIYMYNWGFIIFNHLKIIKAKKYIGES